MTSVYLLGQNERIRLTGQSEDKGDGMGFINITVLIFGILLIRRLAWGRISRRMQYALWLLPLLFLVLKPMLQIPSELSLENLIDLSGEEENMAAGLGGADYFSGSDGKRIAVLAGLEEIEEGQESAEDIVTEKEENRLEGNMAGGWLRVLYYGVAGIMLAVMAFTNVRFLIYCRRKRVYDKRDRRTGLKIYRLEGIQSPFLLGNKIYIDSGMKQNETGLRHIVLHEYCHFRHMDFLWVVVRNLCLVWNWYNPLMWLAVEYIKRDCELACDEAVMDMLGEQERSSYGYTLLAMVRGGRAGQSFAVATTTMSGNGRKMRERIEQVAGGKKKSAVFVCGVLVSVGLLAGCTFTQGAENVLGAVHRNGLAEVKAEEQKSDKGQETFYQNTDGNYYNTVKYFDGYFYYPGLNGLYRMDQELSAEERLAEGNVRLGNCDGDYLYYIRYPSDTKEGCGLLRLNLENLQEELLAGWNDAMWAYSNIYVHRGVMYLEGQGCDAYELGEGKVERLDNMKNLVYRQLEACGLADADEGHLPYGYLNALFQYQVIVWVDGKAHEILIYDMAGNHEPVRLQRCGSDVLMSEQGLVYRGIEDGRLYLRGWREPDSVLLYEEAEAGRLLNLSTCDERYLYGFYEEENQTRGVRISWQGETEEFKRFDSVRLALRLGFSANHGVISYRQGENIVFEEMN